MRTSIHADVRSQQRGIPPFIFELLEDFGSEEHIGEGCSLRYFNKRSIRKMESAIGRAVVQRLAPWHDCYKVVGPDGCAITIGHRYKHIRRR